MNEHLAPIPVLLVPTLMAFGMHNPTVSESRTGGQAAAGTYGGGPP
ncbi:hypothetical protein [Streptomyces sp. UG1]